MTDLHAVPEVASDLTKESLFPTGWDKPQQTEQPEAVAPEAEVEPTEEPAEAADEVLAEAQADDEQVTEETPEPEGAFERRTVGDFAKQAGITQEEFYRDIFRMEDGKEVSVSQAFDDRKALQEANDALLRERAELQEKVTATNATAPVQEVNPEAQALANEAQLKLQAIRSTDWSQVDPGQAANIKLDLQMQAQDLWSKAEQKQAEHTQTVQKQFQERIQTADREVRSRIPEWNDTKMYTRDWQGIRDMAASYGIQAQEIDGVLDPRWRHLFKDALQARAKEARLSKGVKTVRKVGRTAKASIAASTSRATAEPKPTLGDARKRLADARKSGASLEEINRLRLRIPLG